MKKRINYKKLSRSEAQKSINKSRGMTKAKWEKLWAIAHDMRRKK